MLHKAARNAYSWWWASHIRTKQSKWLDQNLQDMEEKVEYTLKIIQEDGDTFSQRAEMYYRKRPELVSFVEDSFRGYRALAERYDHLSRELQSANRTVAAICPERIHLEMDNDFDDDPRDHFLPKPDDHQSSFTLPPPPPPELAKPPTLSSSSGKKNPKRLMSNNNQSAPSSGLNKPEAQAEIDKLQKEILALQTEKEFVKSSYESALAKYWDIENRASEMQTKVSNLQDEFGIGTVIEDDEARTLMIATALKSCHHTLVRLQEKQRQSTKEVAQEHIKIEETRNKFYSLKEKLVDVNNNDPDKTPGMHELEDMVDDFVEKVINLENLVSSQAAQIKRLKSEINNLQSHIQNIEEEEEEYDDDDIVTSNYKVRRVEQELHNVQSLLKSVEDQNDTLQTNFTEAECSHDDLNEKLLNVKPGVSLEITKNKKSADQHENYLPGFLQVVQQVRAANANAERELESALSHQQTVSDNKLQQRASTITKDATRMEGEENRMDCQHPFRGEENEDVNVKMIKDDRIDSPDPKIQAADEKMTYAQNILPEEDEDLVKPDWKALFLNELDDREKILLQEYTTMLRNYKEVKKKLNEVEKKKRASLFQSAVQVKVLRNANSMKDEEIKCLLSKINLIANNNERGPEIHNNNFDGKQDKAGSHSPVEEEKGGGGGEINIIDENFSSLEEKIRMDIDDLLEENIEFWLRFSTSFYQIQKFQTSVDDLQAEVAKLKEKNAHSEIRPIYRHLREIQTELTLWLEHNAVLKDDLQNRLSSLLNLTEEIEKLANTELSNYEAAKFQGEILNMKQENNKVSDQVQAGLERVRRLQAEIQTTLSQLDQQLGISPTNLRNRNRYKIPLRSFLFGVKLKKQKPSLFSCVSPALQKQYIK